MRWMMPSQLPRLQPPAASRPCLGLAEQSAREAHARNTKLRVPNESKSATIAVEVHFPANLRVTAVEQKPGWQAEAIRDKAGNLIGVRWIGSLPPEQFAEFGVLAVNPPGGGELAFTAIQAFADGTKINWSGTAGSKSPAARGQAVALDPIAGAGRRARAFSATTAR